MEDRIEAARAGLIAALEPDLTVTRDAQGAVRIDFGNTPASVQVLPLGDDLLVYSLTQVIAWDLPGTDELTADLAAAGERIQFGALRTLDRGATADVILAYAFPVAELAPASLSEFVQFLIAQGFDLRSRLVA
jgi:hypothetical protein